MKSKETLHVIVSKVWEPQSEPVIMHYHLHDDFNEISNNIIKLLNIENFSIEDLIISSTNPSIPELDRTKTLTEQGITEQSHLYVNHKPKKSIPIRNKDEFEIGKSIGSGVFSSIKLAIDKKNGKQVVIKGILNLQNNDKEYIEREKTILSTIDFPSIIKLYGIIEPYEFDKELIFILEYGSNGDLDKMLIKMKNNKTVPSFFDYTQRCIILYGIAMGMNKLHENDIIHRNLKPRSILLDENFEPLISGFFLSKFIDKESILTGSPKYVAPELLMDEEGIDQKFYDEKLSDAYSFGIIAYYLMTNLEPWGNNIKSQFALMNKITKGERPPIPKNLPKQIADFIKKCWQQNPEERPSFKKIVKILSDENFYSNPAQSFDKERFNKYKQKFQAEASKSHHTEHRKKLNLVVSPMNINEKLIEENEKNTEKMYFIDEEDEKYHVLVENISQNQFHHFSKVIDIRNKRVMCKKVLIPEEDAFKHLQNAMKEFDLFLSINHPCICKIYGINTSEVIEKTDDDDDDEITTVALFLEYLDYDVKDCISKKMLSNTIKAQIAIEIAHGMLHIHNHGLIHRDLRIENIRLNSVLESKIVDLGLAKITEVILPTYSFTQTSFSKNIGNAIYMSPELIKEENYDNKTDVYSYGILLYHLFEGKIQNYTLKDKSLQKDIPLPKPSSSISEFCINLISSCISFDPKSRPSFDEILEAIRSNSYSLASDIDIEILSNRDQELSSQDN